MLIFRVFSSTKHKEKDSGSQTQNTIERNNNNKKFNLLPRRDHDGGAFQADPLGDGEADALSRSRDESYFPNESLSDLRFLHFRFAWFLRSQTS